MKTIQCPICNASGGRLFQVLPDHFGPEEFTAQQCESCSFVFLNPAPEPETMERYYALNESGSNMRRSPHPLFLALQRLRFQRETASLRSLLGRGEGVLDMGAGDGALCRYFHHLGYRAGGVDFYPPDEWLTPEIPYAQLDLHGTGFAPEALRGVLSAPPRAVVVRHVLEHLHQPRLVIEKIRESGAELLFIVVPNRDSSFASRFGKYWYYWDPPRHLHFFTPRDLAQLVERAGFAVRHSGTYGIDEIVTSLYRFLLLRKRDGHRVPAWLTELTTPKGIPAGLSSGLSSAFGSAVCWCVAERQP